MWYQAMRNPAETVQVNLRIKEAERLRVEAAARENGVSLNAEMAARLARTFRQGDEWEANQLVENVRRSFGPLVEKAHEMAMSAEAERAVDALVALIQPLLAAGSIAGPAAAEIKAAIDTILANRGAREAEARIRLARIGAQL
jgi:hypothetical protein